MEKILSQIKVAQILVIAVNPLPHKPGLAVILSKGCIQIEIFPSHKLNINIYFRNDRYSLILQRIASLGIYKWKWKYFYLQKEQEKIRGGVIIENCAC